MDLEQLLLHLNKLEYYRDCPVKLGFGQFESNVNDILVGIDRVVLASRFYIDDCEFTEEFYDKYPDIVKLRESMTQLICDYKEFLSCIIEKEDENDDFELDKDLILCIEHINTECISSVKDEFKKILDEIKDGENEEEVSS